MKDFQEMDIEISNKQSLIKKHQRRLQDLREKKARKGLNTETEIITEIEDIEDDIAVLQDELAALAYQKRRLAAPLVYIRNFGESRTDLPANAHRLEWGEGFTLNPRSVPPVDAWQDLPGRLKELKTEIGAEGLVRLEGRIALTTAFVFGATFKDVGGYQLEAAQYNPGAGKTEYWYSEAPTEQTSSLNARHLPGNLGADDAAIVIYAAPKQSIDDILRGVEKCWSERDTFSAGQTSTQLKGLLSIEAHPALNGENLTPAQAASLAKQSTRLVSDFAAQLEPAQLHLFLAAPVGLAVFLGHRWNMISCPIQCYEFVQVGDKPYTKTCRLRV